MAYYSSTAGNTASSEALVAAVQDLSRQVTAPRQLQRSCVGVAGRVPDWWNSSALLPTTSAPRAPKSVIGIVNTSFGPGSHGRQRGSFQAAGKLPGARAPWIIAHEGAMPKDPQSVPYEALPTESYFRRGQAAEFFNGEGVDRVPPQRLAHRRRPASCSSASPR
jgi:hypothetical protein